MPLPTSSIHERIKLVCILSAREEDRRIHLVAHTIISSEYFNCCIPVMLSISSCNCSRTKSYVRMSHFYFSYLPILLYIVCENPWNDIICTVFLFLGDKEIMLVLILSMLREWISLLSFEGIDIYTQLILSCGLLFFPFNDVPLSVKSLFNFILNCIPNLTLNVFRDRSRHLLSFH